MVRAFEQGCFSGSESSDYQQMMAEMTVSGVVVGHFDHSAGRVRAAPALVQHRPPNRSRQNERARVGVYGPPGLRTGAVPLEQPPPRRPATVGC